MTLRGEQMQLVAWEQPSDGSTILTAASELSRGVYRLNNELMLISVANDAKGSDLWDAQDGETLPKGPF